MTMPDPVLYRLPVVDPTVFSPPPEVYADEVARVRRDVGENSAVFGSVLMQLGVASMTQGSHYHGAALDYFEQALRIHRTTLGEDSLQTAWSHDMLAAAKHAVRDYAGAAADLSEAIRIWERLGEANGIDPQYVERARERLGMFERMAAAQRSSTTD